MANQQVIVSVLSDTKDFAKGMNKVSKTASSTFKKMGGALLGMFALSKVVDVVSEVVDQFKAREDDFGNIGTAYGQKFQDSFSKFSFSLADLGISTTDAAHLGSVLANGFKNAHLSGKELQSTIIRVADISGAMGVEQDTVAKAWESAVRGRTAGMAKLLGMDKKKLDSLIAEKMKTEHLSKAQATQLVLEERSAKYKGEAAKDAKTLGGQLEILKDKWANIGQQIADVVMPYVIQFSTWINDVAMPALQGFGEWLVKNKDWLIPLGIGLGVVAAAFGVVSAAVAIFNAVMALNPVVLIVIAIAALVAALIYFFTQTELGKAIWAGFTKFLGEAWDTIVKTFNTAIAAVSKFLTDLWDSIVKTWDGIVKAFSDAVNAVKTWLTNMWNGIKTTWDTVIRFFTEIPGKVKAVFDSAIEWLVTGGKNILSGLFSGIKTIWNTIDGWFGGIPGKVVGFYAGAIGWLVSVGRDIISGNWSGLKSKWDEVASWFGSIDTKVKGFFDGASSWLKSAGDHIVDGLWAGISNGYSWIKGKIKGWVGDVLAFVKKLFGIASPSKVFAGYGKYMVQGLAQGIEKNVGIATGALDKLSNSMTLDSNLALDTVRAGGTVHQYFIDGVEMNLTQAEADDFKKWMTAIQRKAKAGV